MHVRKTLYIDEALLAQAAHLTGVSQTASLVRMGLEVLIARHRARRLARLGGTEKQVSGIRRRRPGRARSPRRVHGIGRQ